MFVIYGMRNIQGTESYRAWCIRFGHGSLLFIITRHDKSYRLISSSIRPFRFAVVINDPGGILILAKHRCCGCRIQQQCVHNTL